MTEEAATAAAKAGSARSKEAVKTRWNQHATRLVRAAMANADVGYKELAALLHADDPSTDDSADTLTKRVNRGTFTFAFGLRVLRVLRASKVEISHIKTDAEWRAADEAKKKRR